MSAFHDVVLPLRWSLGASGGPERLTEVVELASGAERRFSRLANSRRRYDIGGAIQTPADAHALIGFFEARRGRLHSFRLRDRLDHSSGPPGQAPTASDQTLGAGDGQRTRFALTKAYGDYLRPIRAVVAGSLLVQVGTAVVAGASVAQGPLGLDLVLPSPPPTGSAVSAGFVFDTIVRFGTDRLDLVVDNIGAVRVGSVPLIEVIP